MGNVGPELVVDWSPDFEPTETAERVAKDLGEKAVVTESNYPEGGLLVEL